MKNNTSGPTYGEVIDWTKVPSMHSPTTNYVVKFGMVSWDRGKNYRKAIYVIMEYKGREKRNNPPHYMIEPDESGVSDISKVMKTIEYIKKKNNIEY